MIGVFITNNKDAKWDNNATSAGWLAFPNVTINGNSEWHNTYDKIIKIGESAKFQAYKSVDDKKDHNITGFKFTLSKKVGSDWEVIESVYNGSLIKEDSLGRKIVDENGANKENDVIDPYYVNFSTLKYGDNSMLADDPYYQYVDDDSEFVYKIEETQGKTDDQGNAYFADENASVFYVKVAVTKHQWGNLSKYIYYQVSTPEYYKDEACTQKCDSDPEFKNYTVKGEIGLQIKKYLNEKAPTNQKFNFTVRVLRKDGSLETLITNLQNNGGTLEYSFKYGDSGLDGNHKINDYVTNNSSKKYVYFVISENDVSGEISKDNSYIIAKVLLNNNMKEHQEIDYYRIKPDDVNASKKTYISLIDGSSTTDRVTTITNCTNDTSLKITDADDVAFYNTGGGMLKIHKMVVNDYDGKVVRDDPYAILQNVKFRITYNDGSGKYIYFKGCVGKPGTAPAQTKAKEYPTGTEYDVFYNQGAQWTVVGIPAGSYIVEEVGDGITFDYDPESNTSWSIDTPYAEGWPILSRITKYAVTVDENAIARNDSEKAMMDPKNKSCYLGIGGNNRRATFSSDVSGKGYSPVLVSVGGDIETVQVPNYYSVPVGPLYISKKLSGGTWTDNMTFTFRLSPVTCYGITDSEGNAIEEYNTVPMPSEGGSVVTLGKADESNNVATGKFGEIKYRYEGYYVYKITEDATVSPIQNVIYDSSEYYVLVHITKKGTEFKKSYTYSKLSLPKRTEAEGSTDVTEEFYYLGADVTYYADYSEDSKRCTGEQLVSYELFLEDNADTKQIEAVPFKAKYPDGTIFDETMPFDVYFENFVKGRLAVRKEWQKIDGSRDQHTEPIKVQILRRAGTGSWELFKEVELGTGNNWSWDSDTDLQNEIVLLVDESGNKYEYCARESDDMLKKYDVSYTYADSSGTSKVYGTDGNDPSTYVKSEMIDGKATYTRVNRDTVSLAVEDGQSDYGTVTIINRNIYSNELPHTGGMGDIPYLATGLGTAVAGLLGAGVYSRKKKKDDEE